MRCTLSPVLSMVLVFAAACADQDPSSPRGGAPVRLAAVQPGAGTNAAGFSWLPPMVPAPGEFTQPFDPDRAPVARVICVNATGPTCPVVATFDAGSPPPGHMRVDLEDESYTAVWLATEGLSPGTGLYRLDVEEDGTVLGTADLRVVANQLEVRGVPAGEIALVRGKPFVIKFRLEAGGGTDPDPDPLPVPPDTPIRLAIPDLRFVPQPGDYTDDHPAAPGLLFSPSVLTLSLQASATAGEVNALLRSLGARVVGGAPFAEGAPSGGFLMVRLPTATHAEMEAALAHLRASPLVRSAVQNHPITVGALPSRSTTPGNWTWETDPGTGNWAFEVARVPQMWHLNDRVAASGRRTTVLVADRNFWPGHEDLTFETLLTPDSMIVRPGLPNNRYHGTLVSSSLGATWGNGRGQDGSDPFVRMSVAQIHTDGSEIMVQLRDILLAHPSIWIVNLSWGNGWTENGQITGTEVFRTTTSNETGQLFHDLLTGLVAHGRSLPHIIASAGNDAFDARLNGYASNAALRLNAAPITVVEALRQTGATKTLDLGLFSNFGGHVSAGGTQVQVAGGANTYSLEDGTSFAAPMVAGIVSYLIALDPTLPFPTMTTNPVRDLLVASGQEVLTGAQPVVDGFAAVLALDQRNGNSAFATELADIDDGTADGNERVRADGTINTNTAVARDGRVDMRDFRRFRDWYLQATDQGEHLDGAADHPKKDLNGDGVVGTTGAAENVYPRGDLNGDGTISDEAKPFGKAGPPLADLGVLARFFDDPEYDAADLNTLLSSGDIHVDPSACTASAGATTVTTVVELPGAGEVRSMTHSGPSAPAVLTVGGLGATTPYKVTVTGRDAAGGVVFSEVEEEVAVAPGGDRHLKPTCECPAPGAPSPAGMALSNHDCPALTVSPASTTLPRAATRQFAAFLDGQLATNVTWVASRGSITGTGLFTAPITDGPVTITATSNADPAQQGTATVEVRAFGGLQLSPGRAAVGFGRTRTFSVISGAGPFTWSTDPGAGTISGGVFTAGTTEGEFTVWATSSTGSGSATIVVDRWEGLYAGTVSRNGVLFSRNWSLARFSTTPADSRCPGVGVPCYFTGSIDLGSAALNACYFQPVKPGDINVVGHCDYSASSFPLSLTGVVGNSGVVALTLRSSDSSILMVVDMTKSP